ncbi:hypothetical protein [Streptomyces sp. NBC_01104]|uniref:hypothetical protein n=1 Tax=Streptomyces sp. NBC_01104 TaxID=2903750 RepID=UPI0038697964|nr:hypothetical protein OG450_23760 [Streptomyces sp. NBC_01104]
MITTLRGALSLVFIGIAATVVGTALGSLADEPAWRYLSAVGGLTQLTGWFLYIRARRGGAR